MQNNQWMLKEFIEPYLKDFTMKKLTLFFIMLPLVCHVHSQDLGQLIGQMGEAVLLKKIVENPNLQSKDMKNFLAYFRAGHNSYNNGNYEDAISYYTSASKIISATYDQNLLKIYNKYGWKKILNDSYNNAYAKYQATKSTNQQSLVDKYSSSTKSSSNSTVSSEGTSGSVQAQKCGVCHATGKCSTCHGTGISPNTKRTCGACSGRRICTTCDGTGISGHTTTYGTNGTVTATPVQKAQKCGVCHATGKCSTCYGTGISPNTKRACGACGGSGRCATCNGTGISGYITEYIYH